jgi:formate dehydrogenase major subunit
VPGLGSTFGRGGATTFVQDLENSDCILIEGSNFAECHPVAFRFVMKAKERGATIIHVDPRFTRTSAVADIYAPIRSGSDIVFLGALISYMLENGKYFKEYVDAFTNADHLVSKDFIDTEDLDGIFSGWQHGEGDPSGALGGQGSARLNESNAKSAYDPASWAFEMEDVPNFDGTGTAKVVKRDPTQQDPRCVINVMKRHFSRYTPEMVEDICGTPRDKFFQIAEALAKNSGRDRTTSFAYAVGWTQHTVGVQYIRTAAILQTLLGNMGRPGGGIMALRGHANIQGATDIPTLFDLLPGYLPMPSVARDEQTLAAYLKTNTKPTGWWANTPKYVVSLLKAWYGEHATAENDFCFDYLPQLTGNHSMMSTTVAMKDDEVEGYFVIGQNPSASGMNGELTSDAFEHLKWMVNVDAYETETASFWKREGTDPTTVGTECFYIPSAVVLEKEGTMVNTNRMLQWHDKALEPAGESVTDAWVFYTLGKMMKAHYADSTDPKDRPIQHMTWDYEHPDEHERAKGEPSIHRILKEINGYTYADRKQLTTFADLKDDGSTAAGAWIYTGVCPDDTTITPRNRKGDDWVSLGWGFSWPANRRILYNRASADAAGKPWSERKKYVWWDEAQAKWTGVDVPDFPVGKAPNTPAKPGASGVDAHSGASPFIMNIDGLAQLYTAGTLKDGPLPTHYEPLASPVKNQLYAQQNNPAAQEWQRPDNPYNGTDNPDYPYVLTTYRLTEMSGIMTRYVPWLAELQPSAFAEINPELAVEKHIRNGDWVTITTAVGEMEARALVSGRLQPLRLGKGRRVHQIGIPYNYGSKGHATGDSPGNLIPFVMDPNVSIHEAKSGTCDIRLGRRAARGRTEIDAAVSNPEPEGQPTLHGERLADPGT